MDSTKIPIDVGICLLAEPFLSDINFFRSVILITSHDADGSVGFVINKPTLTNMGDLFDNFPRPQIPVFEGGPVQTNTLYTIHTLGNLIPESIEIGMGLYWGGNFDAICNQLTNPDFDFNQVAFFRGYSGWSAGQLEKELSENAWLVSKPEKELIFPPKNERLWNKLVRLQEDPFAWLLHYPPHPSLN